MQIGPGGEHLSYMAAIINEKHRAAGRGGSGAVMGSKNLRALVCGGDRKIPVFDEAALVQCNKECIAHGSEGGMGAGVVAQFKSTGTSAEYDSCVLQADMPIKNWTGVPDDITEEQMENLTGMIMDPKFKVSKTGCDSCYIKCSAVYKLNRGKYELEHAARPEYESLGAFGAMLAKRRSRRGRHIEPPLQRIRLRHALLRQHHLLADGLLQQRHLYPRGAGRHRPQVGRRRGDSRDRRKNLRGTRASACRSTSPPAPPPGHSGRAKNASSPPAASSCPCTARASTPASRASFQYDPTPGRHIKGGRGVPFGHAPMGGQVQLREHGEG